MTQQFKKGDIVQVEYSSPGAIERWMLGWELPGPGDLGVVRYTVIEELRQTFVSVDFPLLGTRSVHAVDLRVVGRVGEADDAI